MTSWTKLRRELQEEIARAQKPTYLHVEVEGDQELLQQLSNWMVEAIELMSDGKATVVTNKVRNKTR